MAEPSGGGPLIVQSDQTMLLEVAHPAAEECRADISSFAELERSPEHVHTYRLTDLGLWNARAAGIDAETIIDALIRHSRFPVPHPLLVHITEVVDRWGRLVLEDEPAHGLVLRCDDPDLLTEIATTCGDLVSGPLTGGTIAVPAESRGRIKQKLLGAGWPVDDLARLVDGEPCEVTLGADLELRPYQRQAVTGFLGSGAGVVVLPCGAGKTLVAIAAMAELGVRTLVLVTSALAARQWRAELCRWTSLDEDDIGEYSGRSKQLRPVTIATYSILTSRTKGERRHFGVVSDNDWGLVVYDEVHLLPAPVFQLTADIQSRRRLGLTATLVREDGREDDVFSLIGPKRFDAPWRDLEQQGWIAPATCSEVRVTLTDEERRTYAATDPDLRPQIAAGVASKDAVVEALLDRHRAEPTLVIGTYVDQLEHLAERLGLPIITGSTRQARREELFDAFRVGELASLVVSKVGNFSLDLPDATAMIQVSGTFGSRQEEAQRLGRLLRPKRDGRQAHFYTVVARDTVEQEHAAKRQRFLAEQGYAYSILDAENL